MHNEAHFHRRNLPHIYIPNSTYFITSRLKGSISEKQIKELRAWKRNQKQAKNKEDKYKQDIMLFGKYDELLHDNTRSNHL